MGSDSTLREMLAHDCATYRKRIAELEAALREATTSVRIGHDSTLAIVQAAVDAEREACAKIAEARDRYGHFKFGDEVAAAIRARAA